MTEADGADKAGQAQGAEAEMEQIFLRYSKGVGSFMLARVGDAELAEELTARVFVLVVQRHWQCRGNVAGWVWAIAQNVLARHYRRSGRHRPPMPLRPTGPAADPREAAEIREMQERLPLVLAELSEQQQEVVYLKYFQDLGNLEIAEATGMTPSNVGVTLHRTLRRLRELMEEPRRERKTGTDG